MNGLFAMLLACDGNLNPVPGTTTRIEKPQVVEGTELELKIFTTLDDCRASVSKEDTDLCLPHVDRAAGEVRLGFQFRLDSDDFPLPLTKEHVEISHLGTVIQDGVGGQAYTVVPHDPVRSKQLFILLIDGSSSMWEQSRMEKVRNALLLPEVKDAFFPGDVKTGVVIMQFTDGQPMPVDGATRVITNKNDYHKTVKSNLQVLSGYTHLYDAIKYATGELLQNPEIDRAIKLDGMAPTIVALTDGFNNMARDDTCRTNAARLETLLKHLEGVRQGDDVDIRARPTVYTVGLGKPLRPRFELPEEVSASVRPIDLCGKRYVDRRIDGDLEMVGIDNASLSWIAHVGGGFSYVKNNKKGLGEAFRGAAAKHYYWFEARYRLDPLFLRRSFKTGLRLVSYAESEASVVIHPSAWLDAPPGRRGEDGWTVTQPYTHTATIVMPVLGFLVIMSFMSAAWYNTKRALFARQKSRPKRAAGPGLSPGQTGHPGVAPPDGTA